MQNYKVLTREELYDLVWSMPMKKIAEIYEISDRGLSKACNKMNIPVPYPGYWNRVIAGTAEEKPELPKLPKNYYGQKEITLRERPDDFVVKKKVKKKFLDEKIQGDITKIPDELLEPHPLVESVRIHLTGKVPDNSGRMKNILIADSGFLDIRISPESLPRGLRAYDMIIKSCEKEGFTIKINFGECFFLVDGELVKIRLYEKVSKKRAPRRLDFKNHTLVPTGFLVFEYLNNWAGRKWVERKGYDLGYFLDSIVKGLKDESVRVKEEREKVRLAEERDREFEKIKYERRDAALTEAKFMKHLIRQTDRHHLAIRMRMFLDTLESKRKEEGQFDMERSAAFKRARLLVDWLDPTVQKTSETLDLIDPDTLEIIDYFVKDRYEDNWKSL
ncbi:hypothetical protein [Aquiflexum gelatinilyticum]|uniref:hypothetical protein n=1 Tax=Aquiflexum gelatinilyticum TaxID=2961943 RepID=UPI0021690638|nr:hypothetical protein [Aquiflexum gelatinilyticum]MCS4432841.1 hypothetical protein [Aquiflexum gelatinilyticum]